MHVLMINLRPFRYEFQLIIAIKLVFIGTGVIFSLEIDGGTYRGFRTNSC